MKPVINNNIKFIVSSLITTIISTAFVVFLFLEINANEKSYNQFNMRDLEYMLGVEYYTFKFDINGDTNFILTKEDSDGKIEELRNKPIFSDQTGEGYGVIYFKNKDGISINKPLQNMNDIVSYTFYLKFSKGMYVFNDNLTIKDLTKGATTIFAGAKQTENSKHPFLTIKNENETLRFRIGK